MQTHFEPSNVAICLATYYPKWYSGRLRSIKHIDKVRGDLAIEFVKKASRLGFRIILADSRSTKKFRKIISQIPNLHFVLRRDIRQAPGKRLALYHATLLPSIKVIVLVEAEKVSFLNGCIQKTVLPIINREADIVVPKREQKLFYSTYPKYMYESEIEANILYNEALRSYGLLSSKDSDYDFFFGPRVFANSKRVVNLFMRRYELYEYNKSSTNKLFNLENYSNVLYFPLDLAFLKNFSVKSVEVAFSYPKIQKKNEEVLAKNIFIEKRRQQKLIILSGLFHFLAYLKKMKSSQIRPY